MCANMSFIRHFTRFGDDVINLNTNTYDDMHVCTDAERCACVSTHMRIHVHFPMPGIQGSLRRDPWQEAPGLGPGQGPGSGLGPCPGLGPVRGPGPGPRPGSGPGLGPVLVPGLGSGLGPGPISGPDPGLDLGPDPGLGSGLGVYSLAKMEEGKAV